MSSSSFTTSDLTHSERLCEIDLIPDGGAREVSAHIGGASESLILLRRGMEIRAFLNICPHAGRRLDWAPGRFLIDQGMLACAAHGACFSVPDGYCVAGLCRGQTLRELPVVLREGAVFLSATPGRAEPV